MREAPASTSLEVVTVLRLLADAVEVDLPVLEQAVQSGDYDIAYTRAAALRTLRLRVRGVLGGGEVDGTLRAEWSAVEPRIDAALTGAPRANANPRTGKRTWLGQLRSRTATMNGRRRRAGPVQRRLRFTRI